MVTEEERARQSVDLRYVLRTVVGRSQVVVTSGVSGIYTNNYLENEQVKIIFNQNKKKAEHIKSWFKFTDLRNDLEDGQMLKYPHTGKSMLMKRKDIQKIKRNLYLTTILAVISEKQKISQYDFKSLVILTEIIEAKIFFGKYSGSPTLRRNNTHLRYINLQSYLSS